MKSYDVKFTVYKSFSRRFRLHDSEWNKLYQRTISIATITIKSLLQTLEVIKVADEKVTFIIRSLFLLSERMAAS
jgi:hypothetical protein